MARSLVVLLTAAALVLPASASAAFTGSQITSPADVTFKQADFNNPTTLHVEGTTTGGAGNADLVCFFGTTRKVLLTNVTVTAGAFSVDAPITTFTNNTPKPYCVLRAVPTGDATVYPPDAASAFQGPHVGFGRFSENKVSGGPNNGAVYDFFSGLGQKQGYMDYLSLGGCGLDWSFLFDPITLAQSASLYYCNAWVYPYNGCGTASATCEQGTRNELLVDGNPGYPPPGQRFPNNGSQQAGFMPLVYSRTIDPLNGDTHSTESNPIAKCSPNPAFFSTDQAAAGWGTDCTSWASSGITVNRTLLGDRDGRRALFTDVYNSTDGQAHDIDLMLDQEFSGAVAMAPPSFQYPWIDGDFHVPAKGDNVAGTTGGQVTISVDGNGPTGDVFNNPQGAMTFSMAPKAIHWYQATQYAYGWFQFTFTVPAGGSVTMTHSYLQGATKDEVNAAAAGERDSMGAPSVAITSPANGATVQAAGVLVTGTSSDPGGAVTSVKVNGAAATLNPDGSWSLPVTLAQGANTLTAVASDAAGNTASSSVNVTFTPPPTIVPPTTSPTQPDKTPPVLGLTVAKTKLGKLISKGLPVTVSSNEACTFTLTLFSGKTKIGTAKGTLTKAGKLKVRVKLTKKAKKKLARTKKLKATLKLAAKDKAGNAASKSKKITFKR